MNIVPALARYVPAISVIVIGCGAVFLWKSGTVFQHERPHQEEEEGALETVNSAKKRSVRTGSTGPSANARPNVDAGPDQSIAHPMSAKVEAIRREEERIQELDAMLTEQEDLRQAELLETSIRNDPELRKLLSTGAASISAITCGEKLCRIEAEHATMEDRVRFGEALIRPGGLASRGASVFMRGTKTSRSYVFLSGS